MILGTSIKKAIGPFTDTYSGDNSYFFLIINSV